MDKDKDITSCSSSFDESEHPRNSDGKFSDNGTQAEQKRANELLGNDDAEETKVEDIAQLLGKEFKGFKGQAAVDKLISEKQGHIKGAFTRADIGGVDLIWGDDFCGLKHIIMRRTEQGIDATKFVSEIASVVENGAFRKKNDKGNFEFFLSGKIVVISPELQGNKITFLLTAFKTHSKK